MKIDINFEHPLLDEETILKLTTQDLDCFYADETESNRFNLFFVLEASLHKLQSENRRTAAARCAFLLAYDLFTPLTPPASLELAKFYINNALAWDDTPEYRQWKKIIDGGN